MTTLSLTRYDPSFTCTQHLIQVGLRIRDTFWPFLDRETELCYRNIYNKREIAKYISYFNTIKKLKVCLSLFQIDTLLEKRLSTFIFKAIFPF